MPHRGHVAKNWRCISDEFDFIHIADFGMLPSLKDTSSCIYANCSIKNLWDTRVEPLALCKLPNRESRCGAQALYSEQKAAQQPNEYVDSHEEYKLTLKCSAVHGSCPVATEASANRVLRGSGLAQS